MRVMTYNIFDGGVDSSDDSRLGSVLTLIDEQRPDVLVLNECNHFDANRNRTLHRVERTLGMRGLLARTTTGYHVAVFLRDATLLESSAISKPAHHAIMHVKALWNGQSLSVVGAHLCPFGGTTRVTEAEYLTRFARDDDWVILAGDLNAISPSDTAGLDMTGWPARRSARHLFDGGVDTRAIATLERAGLIDLARSTGQEAPTVWPSDSGRRSGCGIRIDYIFGNAKVAAAVRSAHVIDDARALAASDHLPVVVDLDTRP
jgi:endonuclease/exonuclease/phosphatase family metal-dependent hydrolase